MKMKGLKATAVAAALLAGGATGALAGNPHATGAPAASSLGVGGASTAPGGAGAAIGSGGSAAAGGTSASSLGLGASATGAQGASRSLGVGGSAAGGRTMSHSGVHGNGNALNGQSMNQAHERGGIWSKSHTHTMAKHGRLTTRTKSMAHMPGGPPVKSTSGLAVSPGATAGQGR